MSPTLAAGDLLRATVSALGSQVRERDDIARIVLQYGLGRYRRAALFVIKKEMLVGWEGGGQSMSRSAVRGIMVPLTNPSIFKTVYETKVLYCGGVPRTTVNDIFFNAIGDPRPERVIVVPFVLKDKVACVLYADGGDIEKEENPASIGELYQLGRAVSGAFENLILRTKRGS
jgi:hypothetical protein